MQQLQFHPAWDKTISDKDRTQIEELFEATYENMHELAATPLLRAAFNHKNELLVTVLIHNFTHKSLQLKNRNVQLNQGDFFHEQAFNVPEIIPAFTSMPWTFIFESHDQFHALDLADIQIDIDDTM